MKPKRVISRFAIFLLVLGVVGGAVFLFFEHEGLRNDDLVLYGNTDIRQVRLAFFDTGRIKAVHVQEGDHVETGQLLAELDAARYQAAVAKAGAQVGAQEKVVARMTAGSRPEEIAGAKARVSVAEAALRDANLKQQRAREMAKEEYVSQQQLDDADTAVEVARATLEALQQTAILAVKGPRTEDISAAIEQLKADRATLDLTTQELADTKLYAPTNGVIRSRLLEPGDMASPQSSVLTLALNDPVWVRAYISEPDLGKLSEGTPAEVTTDSFPGKTYEGWVGYISPTAEFTPKQIETTDLRTRLVYQVRVFVKNPQNELRLGMPATVRILHRADIAQGK